MVKKNLHKKPTQEELKKDIEEATKKLDTQEPVPSEPVPSEPAPSEPAPSEEAPEPTPSEPAPSPDYKKKFISEARQNQKIYAKNRKLNQAIDETNEIEKIEEEEIASEFPDWDIMSDTEKKLAKEAIVSKRYRERIYKAREEGKKIEKWDKDVDKFIEDPKNLITYPDLEGKTDEFKIFATKESNNSVPMKVLVSAFLHDVSKGTKKKTGKMFEQGTGGPNTKIKQKGNKISIAEARGLMQNNYKEYKRLLIAGKIDTSEVL